jgi:ribonuclease T2
MNKRNLKSILVMAVIFVIVIIALMFFYNLFIFENNEPTTSQHGQQEQKIKPQISGQISQDERDADFDFYVLSLSWSPSFCEENRGKGGLQCSKSNPRPYAFIVHGLWPQHNKGWPEFCHDNPRKPKKSLINSMLDIMPSRGLIKHEWKKHGTCSGLNSKAYFDKTRAAYDAITIPPAFKKLKDYKTTTPKAVEAAFIKANDGLQDNMLGITCSRNYLQEVRICMDKALNFHACPSVDRSSCKRAKITMPPNR